MLLVIVPAVKVAVSPEFAATDNLVPLGTLHVKFAAFVAICENFEPVELKFNLYVSVVFSTTYVKPLTLPIEPPSYSDNFTVAPSNVASKPV